MNIFHTPVLLKETIENLNIKKNGIYIDATFGCGGHSNIILSKLGKYGFLYAFDRDPNAIALAKKINDNRFQSIYAPFSKLKFYVQKYNLIGKIDGILLDLGLSSLQIDDPNRGFSFMKDGPLDMRMDAKSGISAADYLFCSHEKDIAFILKNFGEEPFSKRIARAIVNRKKKIRTTKELVNLICSVVPKKSRNKHPARRSFQAIRIYINDELKELQQVLENSLEVLAPLGRLVVISFHSLEDRMVKRFIRYYSYPKTLKKHYLNKDYSKNFKCKNLGKTFPTTEEIIKNKRARSAVLRVAERVLFP